MDENMSNFALNAVLADGLAPLGARPSARTGMTNFESRPLKGLNISTPVSWNRYGDSAAACCILTTRPISKRPDNSGPKSPILEISWKNVPSFDKY